MNEEMRRYTIEAAREQLSRYDFYLTVKSCAVVVFAPYVGKKITRREASKLLAAIQETYPQTSLYFKDEKWGRECQFLESGGWGAKGECREYVSIESLTSEKIYTQELHDKAIERFAIAQEHRKDCAAQLASIHELIDLQAKQDLELEELQARQSLERETFVSQTKCHSADISGYIKQAHERRQSANRDKYYSDLEAERVKRLAL